MNQNNHFSFSHLTSPGDEEVQNTKISGWGVKNPDFKLKSSFPALGATASCPLVERSVPTSRHRFRHGWTCMCSKQAQEPNQVRRSFPTHVSLCLFEPVWTDNFPASRLRRFPSLWAIKSDGITRHRPHGDPDSVALPAAGSDARRDESWWSCLNTRQRVGAGGGIWRGTVWSKGLRWRDERGWRSTALAFPGTADIKYVTPRFSSLCIFYSVHALMKLCQGVSQPGIWLLPRNVLSFNGSQRRWVSKIRLYSQKDTSYWAHLVSSCYFGRSKVCFCGSLWASGKWPTDVNLCFGALCGDRTCELSYNMLW